jgi:hypothetical protein
VTWEVGGNRVKGEGKGKGLRVRVHVRGLRVSVRLRTQLSFFIRQEKTHILDSFI